VVPEGDLCDETFARQVVAGCQALIHLAPPAGLPQAIAVAVRTLCNWRRSCRLKEEPARAY
jgi:hypothetical protein